VGNDREVTIPDTTPDITGSDQLGQALGAIAPGDARQWAKATRAVRASMRAAGARSVASGQWLADAVLDVAGHLPVRDLETLQAHHHGLSGRELADRLIRNATKTTAGIGAAAGAVAAVEEFAPPAWLALPAELMVEILGVVAVEMKLVAELHEVYHQPINGTPGERALAVGRAWAERRGVSAATVANPAGMTNLVGATARREVTRLVRRRLARRTARSVWTLAPLLVGAAAGATINRRATRSLGQAVRDDLETMA